MQPSLNDVIARLARECARGTRQLNFVNELLIDAGYIKYETAYFNGHGQTVAYYGDSRLGHKSWQALRKRLTEAGFIIKYDHQDPYKRTKATMRFSV